MQPQIILFPIFLILSSSLADIPPPPLPKSDTDNHNHAKDTISLRLISSNANKSIQVSPGFLQFLKQDLQSQEFKGSRCTVQCADNLYYIRRMQTEYGVRSLYELFYFLSMTRDCFCYDAGFLDGFGGGSGVTFEWQAQAGLNFDFSFGGKNTQENLNSSRTREDHEDHEFIEDDADVIDEEGTLYENDHGPRCSWRNIIYWLVMLIRGGIYDLRHINLNEVCYSVICHQY